MIYLPKKKFKIYLIILCGLIFCNVCLVNTKNYHAVDPIKGEIFRGDEEQYLSCLNSLSEIYQKNDFIKTTRINYFWGLPKESLLYIYFGYFLIVSMFILSSKFELKESENDIK